MRPYVILFAAIAMLLGLFGKSPVLVLLAISMGAYSSLPLFAADHKQHGANHTERHS